MPRRFGSSLLVAILVAAMAPSVALADVFDGCSLTGATLAPNVWTSESLYREGSTDVDWFKFTPAAAGWHLITLASPPADYKLEVWGSCSAPAYVSNRPGPTYEEIYVYLTVKRWNVRITSSAGAYSPTAYKIRQKPLAEGVQVLSSASFLDTAGKLHFVGEVLNNTDSRRAGMTVRASMYSAGNTHLGYLTGGVLRAATHARRRVPFHIVITPPAGYHHLNNISTTSGTVPAYWPVGGLTVTPLPPSYALGGVRHFEGQVTNGNAFVARNVTPILTLYKPDGAVMNAGRVMTSPSSIEPTNSEYFDLGLAGPWWGVPAWDVEASK